MHSVEAVRTPAVVRKPFRIVPQLDTYPALVRFAQTPFGRAVLLAIFAAGLFANQTHSWIELAVAAGIVAYFPAQRRLLLTLTTLYWLVFHSTWVNWTFLSSIAGADGQPKNWTIKAIGFLILATAFALLAVYFQYVRNRRDSFAAKRSVLCLVTASFLLLFLAALLPAGGKTHFLIWIAVVVTSPYLWYFAYALKDASAKTPDGPLLQFGTLRPIWGGSNVPYAKGAANLRKTEVHTAEALSIVQLKAIKLLIWVFILRILLRILRVVVFGEPTSVLRFIGLGNFNVPHLNIPDLDVALGMAKLSVSTAWMSLIGHFAQAVLDLTIGGHIIIACGRMAGFNLLRNTYKPLYSRTVGEFWNRYYYYFKELLVEFFFFPTFTRYFKQHRQLRIFAATVAAATLGNMIYHFLHDYWFVAQLGLWNALVGFHVYFFYCAVLGIGIGISQLRGQGKNRLRDDARWWRKAIATAGVLAFFCLIEVFDQEGRSLNLWQCTHFFLRLFFIPV